MILQVVPSNPSKFRWDDVLRIKDLRWWQRMVGWLVGFWIFPKSWEIAMGFVVVLEGWVYVPINDVEIIQFKCLFFKLCWRSPFPFLSSQNVSLWNVCLDVRLSAAPAKNGWTHHTSQLSFLSSMFFPSCFIFSQIDFGMRWKGLSRWWFPTIFIVTPKRWSNLTVRIFFRWVGEKPPTIVIITINVCLNNHLKAS